MGAAIGGVPPNKPVRSNCLEPPLRRPGVLPGGPHRGHGLRPRDGPGRDNGSGNPGVPAETVGSPAAGVIQPTSRRLHHCRVLVTSLFDAIDTIAAAERACLRSHGALSMITRKTTRIVTAALAAVLGAMTWAAVGQAAGPVLIAIGTISGVYEDFAIQTAAPLENGVPGNRLGGIGSGLAYSAAIIRRHARSRTECRGVQPVHGRHGVVYQPLPHDAPEPVAERSRFDALPFTLTPMVVETTLLSSIPRWSTAPAGRRWQRRASAEDAITRTTSAADPTTSIRPAVDQSGNARFDPEASACRTTGTASTSRTSTARTSTSSIAKRQPSPSFHAAE